jgi:hypothetical protein
MSEAGATLRAVTDSSFAQGWGPLIAAGFAAAAAAAVWVSATHARRTWRDSQRPHLSPILIEEVGHPLILRIRNFGGGPAKKVSFYIVIEDQQTGGYMPPDGILESGATVAAALDFKGVDPQESRYVVMCLDRENNTFVWSKEDKVKVFRRRRWSKIRPIESFFGKVLRVALCQKTSATLAGRNSK